MFVHELSLPGKRTHELLASPEVIAKPAMQHVDLAREATADLVAPNDAAKEAVSFLAEDIDANMRNLHKKVTDLAAARNSRTIAVAQATKETRQRGMEKRRAVYGLLR